MFRSPPLSPNHLTIHVCLARLVVLFLLLIPLALTWMETPSQKGLLTVVRTPEYQAFLVSGFSLTIFFLLARNAFTDLILFFRLQLLADLLLVCFLMAITGGVQSSFSFLCLGLIFLYGRILGLQAASILAVLLGVFYLGLGLIQGLGLLHPLAPDRIIFYVFLHLLALALMYLLVRLGSGRLGHMLQDIAERDKLLRQTEAVKRRVFDWMSSGLLVIDRQGVITAINSQGLKWAGLNHMEQALGSSLDRLYPNLHQIWTTWDGAPLRTEFTMHTQLFGATLTSLPDGQGTLILFTDITRIKELERQVQDMEKMATVGELAAGLAHEIKNPLAGIKASLQLLPSSTLSESKRQRLYQVIERDVQRLNHLLTNFLTFARPKEAKPYAVDLYEAVRSCVLPLQNDFPQLEVSIDRSLQGRSWIWDPDQLHQVLLNLIMNAAQAAQTATSPQVHISCSRQEGTERLCIADNGPGVDPEIESRIFDPFTTTKAKGSGLGLSIARRLATQNQAWIEIGTAPEGGARATLTWTAADMEAEHAADTSASVASSASERQ